MSKKSSTQAVVQTTTTSSSEPPKRRRSKDSAARQLTIALIGSRTRLTPAMITKTKQIVARVSAINATLLINNDAGIASIARAEALRLAMKIRLYATNQTTLNATPNLHILKHSSYIVRDQEMRKAADWVVAIWNEAALTDAAFVMYRFASLTRQNCALYGSTGSAITGEPRLHAMLSYSHSTYLN